MQEMFTDNSHVIIVFAGNIELLVWDAAGETRVQLNSQLNCIYIPQAFFYKIIYCSEQTAAFIASDKSDRIFSTGNHIINYEEALYENYQLHN